MLTVSRNAQGGGIELEVLIEELMEGATDQGEGSNAQHGEEGQGAAQPPRRVVRIGGGMLNSPLRSADGTLLTAPRPGRAPFSNPTRVSGSASGTVPQSGDSRR